MTKTSVELGKEIIELIEKMKKAHSPFETANLSQKALEITKEWGQAKELEKRTQESKPEPKDVEVQLLGEIIFSHPNFGYNHLRIRKEDMPHNAIIMAQYFLEATTGVVYKFDDKERLIAHPVGLRNYLIQILEEKFGLTIKICGNCKDYNSGCSLGEFYSCKIWAPKEIPPEKKEEPFDYR